MQAEQSLREGRVQDALTELQAAVRREPANAKYRVFLFQLLAVLGQWERALNQLNVLGEMDAASLPMVQTYREAIRCEWVRADVFAGRRSPLVFGDPEPWMALMLEAVRLGAEARGITRKRKGCATRRLQQRRRLRERWTSNRSPGWPTPTHGWDRCWKRLSMVGITGFHFSGFG